MCECEIVKYCSCTFAGIKCANLFTCEYKTMSEVFQDIVELNKRFKYCDIHFKIMKFYKNRVLIYVYRKNILATLLNCNEVHNFLKTFGYSKDVDDCLLKLENRITSLDSFPHEIGIFLDYPLADVKGFIKNSGKAYLVKGPWKVYSNEKRCIKRFDSFKKCKKIYMERFQAGYSLDKLAIVRRSKA